MYNQDDPRQFGPLAKLSLKKLAEYAIAESLIDGLEELEDRVIITQGDSRFVLPPRQASTFLIGMLRGRSWFIEDAGRPAAPPETEPPEFDETLPPRVPSRPTREYLEPSVPRTTRQGGGERTLDSTLDSLLEFALEVGIIKGYTKNIEERTVRIDIAACSTDLTYIDALGYLIDCVQHEMRALRRKT